MMSREVKAILVNGQVKPIEPLDVPEDSQLRIIVEEPTVAWRKSTEGNGADPMATIYEIAEDIGPADLARNLDHYLYGLPKE